MRPPGPACCCAPPPQAGLEADCPFDPPGTPGGRGALTAEEAEAVGEAEFDAYASRLYQYLQVGLEFRV